MFSWGLSGSHNTGRTNVNINEVAFVTVKK